MGWRSGASHFSDLTELVGANPPWLPLPKSFDRGRRGSARGHDPYQASSTVGCTLDFCMGSSAPVRWS